MSSRILESAIFAIAPTNRVTDITKNKFDGWCRQAAYNISRALKILRVATVKGSEVRLVVKDRADHHKLSLLLAYKLSDHRLFTAFNCSLF